MSATTPKENCDLWVTARDGREASKSRRVSFIGTASLSLSVPAVARGAVCLDSASGAAATSQLWYAQTAKPKPPLTTKPARTLSFYVGDNNFLLSTHNSAQSSPTRVASGG